MMIAGITYLSWPEQTHAALPRREQYEQAYSRGIKEDSFLEYHAAAVRKQNNILAAYQEFEEGYGDSLRTLLLVVLGVWIGPSLVFNLAIAWAIKPCAKRAVN